MINILILSVGIRNKMVEYFRRELEGKGNVIAADCSGLAPALYAADKYYITPRYTEDNYLEELLDICRKENISGVFSLIDPELSVLAKNRAEFEKAGTKVLVSSYELCEVSLDKYAMYERLKALGITTAKCYADKGSFKAALERGDISYPVFVKPVKGSASLNINKVENETVLNNLFDSVPDLMIQEYMPGVEYDADAYVDMITGKCVSVFMKRKIRMRAGEADKAVSVNDGAVLKMVADFAEKMGYRGMIDVDLFEDNGTWYVSEVNPRFGGGYPHAYESGVNFCKYVIKNLSGEVCEAEIGNYESGIYMMKYSEIMVRKGLKQ